MSKRNCTIFFFLFLIPTALYAEDPLHKTLKAYQNLRLDVCKDLRDHDAKDLAKDLKETQKFLEKQKQGSGGKALRFFKISIEDMKRVIRDVEHRGIKKDERLERAFFNGALALQTLLRTKKRQVELDCKALFKEEEKAGVFAKIMAFLLPG